MSPSAAFRNRRFYPTIHRFGITDFSGGLNVRDSPLELADNESPDCWNVTLDAQGAVLKRLGYSMPIAIQVAPATPSVIFYVHYSGDLLIQSGTSVYRYAGGQTLGGNPVLTGALDTIKSGLITSAKLSFCEHLGLVICCSSSDGVSVWTPGTGAGTWQTVAGSPKGKAIALWQNRIWVLDGGSSAKPARLWFSEVDDPFTWPTLNYVDLDELNSDPGTNLQPIGPALIAFKADSTYRVNDSNTGSYTTLDPQVGCVGPQAARVANGVVYFVGRNGLYGSNGGTPVELSKKVQPLFREGTAFNNYTALSQVCMGGPRGRKLYISLPDAITIDGFNHWSLEFDIDSGSFVPHSFGAQCYAEITSFLPSLAVVRAGFGQIWLMGSVGQDPGTILGGGQDGGSNIASWWTSKPFDLLGADQFRLRRCEVECYGAFTLRMLKNLNPDPAGEGAKSYALSVVNAGDSTLAAPDLALADSGGTGRYVAYRVEETSMVALNTRRRLSGAVQSGSYGPKTGAFGVFGIRQQFLPLGVS